MWRFAEPSYNRNLLIGIMLFWIPLCISILIRTSQAIYDEELLGYLSNRMVLMGMVAILSWVIYGASVIFHRRLNYKKILIGLIPAIVVTAVNFILHSCAKVPISYIHDDWELLIEELGEPFVIVRFAMLAVQLAYIIFFCVNMYQLIPIYNKYICDNESNEQYNVDWLYTFIVAFLGITIVYSITIIVQTPFTVSLYCVVTSLCYALLIDFNIRFHQKDLSQYNNLNLYWSFKRGWELKNREEIEDVIRGQRDEAEMALFEQQLHDWIIETKQYADISFSMSDVLNHFDESDSNHLIEVLERCGYSFQSYIREIRILEAIKILRSRKDDDCEKVRYKELYYQVGFSHYSSFARAFTAVVGVSPSQYDPKLPPPSRN